MKFLPVGIIMMLISIFACQHGKPEMINLPDDFVDFYDKFLHDSTFQMAHIQFPLEGLPSYVDSVTASEHTFRWNQEDWIINQPFDEKSQQFERKFRQLTDRLVEEVISQRNGQLGTIRRFYKSDDDWKLIYFSGLNAMSIK